MSKSALEDQDESIKVSLEPQSHCASWTRAQDGKGVMICSAKSLSVTCLQAVFLSVLCGTAKAEGEFLQFDFADGAQDAVASISRGDFSFGGSYSEYSGGSSAGLSATHAFAIQDIGTIRIGPSLGKSFGDDDKDMELGAKIVFEHWSPTQFGYVFLLGDYNTIDNAYFAAFQAGFGQSGLAAEVTVGGSDNYEATTLSLIQRIGDGPVYLRGGYKFDAETAFFGVAINTF